MASENKAVELALRSVHHMLENDPFSQWLGVEIVHLAPGEVTLEMAVRREMLNGFGVIHGGVLFALADSAFAFASNSHGRVSLALECNITFMEKVLEGDRIQAVAREERCGRHIGVYTITLLRNGREKVALFRGSVFRTGRPVVETE
ncbi:MAG: hydroxyphenylacetyl-CoA thioesterase PaaI [Calditrichaeota bacterium]|nr:MAG: hydroxyphenylacetyl-CoA thioesterase PaaI [Calditrichota bacterium]